MNPRHPTNSFILINLVFLLSLISLISSRLQDQHKPEKCEGTLKMEASIPIIKGIIGNEFTQEVGNLTFSLDMSGNYLLQSTTQTFNCTKIITQSNSTSVARTLQNVYSSGEISCVAEPQDIDSSWTTLWTRMSFSGVLYISTLAHDSTCATAPTVIDRLSSCTYNATSDGGMKGSGVCKWQATGEIHHSGDPDPRQQASGEGGEGGDGQGEQDGGDGGDQGGE